VSLSSKYRGLYGSLLEDGFLVGWFKLVGFKVLADRILFFREQFSDIQNLVGASHRSAPPAT